MSSASPVGLLLTAFLLVASASWAAEPDARVGEEATGGTTQPAQHRAANRLARETSPYLLLHAHNPIDWYPWGPEAFEKARQENKPIFLSIGYSSCFWCHVMERESFSDEEIAAYMNEHFVNIKVDREERPDVDDIYMLALQIYHQVIRSSQGGGWPLSMFLTPAGKPIAGGTYFPPRTKNGLPGFLSVARQIQQVWTEQPEQMQAAADVIAREVRRASLPAADLQPVPLDRSLVENAVAAVKEQYDPKFGGVDFDAQRPNGPKFPVPTRLMLLQSQLGEGADPQLADILEATLDHMLRGGIRDHLGGGFHRYSTDRQWLVPHFEKMLYDNAQLAELYARAYARTGRQDFRAVAEDTFAFVLREMTDPQGGFYSALDAETDGIEGKHYVWSPEEIARVLGEEDAALFSEVYGVKPPMFFEHGYVLHLPQSLAQAAESRGIPEDELRGRLSPLREKLRATRAQRPPLLKDDKILTSWNGLMIRAMARGGERLERPDLIEAAERAARFILSTMRDDEGRLLRTHRRQLSHLNAYLDDYAFLVDGLLALHDVTGRPEWLAEARQLTGDQIELFWDEDAGAFYFTSDHHEELLARTKNAYDSVLPSGNSVSVRNLVQLGRLTGEAEYSERARKTLEVFAANMKQQPGSMTFLALALDEYLTLAETGQAQPGSSSALPTVQGEEADAGGIEIVAQKPPTQSSRSSREGDREPLVVAAQSDPRKTDAKVSAKAYLSVDKLTAGQTVRVAVILTVAEGWHINANPASPDFLEPTELALQAAHKTTLPKVDYPKGRNFVMEGFDEPLSVYEKQVVIRGTLKVPPEAAGKTERIDLEVHYQACDDRRCLRPTEVTLTFEVPVVAAGTPVKSINQRLFRPSK